MNYMSLFDVDDTRVTSAPCDNDLTDEKKTTLDADGIVAHRLETNGYVKFANGFTIQWVCPKDNGDLDSRRRLVGV